MGFATSGYYKQLVVDNISDYKAETNPDMKECILRNIISRAYYTMLLHCRDNCKTASTTQYTDGSHERIIKSVRKGSIRTLLLMHKSFRVKADYHTDTHVGMPLVNLHGTQIWPDNILAQMNHILKDDCH